MTFEDEMPIGWYKAFGKEMEKEISDIITKKKIDDFEILQIKEKFGTLRFYYAPYDKDIENIVNKYEELSAKTCVSCGEPATKVSVGWISPWCDICAEDVHDNFEPIDRFFGTIENLE